MTGCVAGVVREGREERRDEAGDFLSLGFFFSTPSLGFSIPLGL